MSSPLQLALRARAALACCALALISVQASPSASAEARARLNALRQEIAHHDALYFKQAAPEISDADYDRLKQELRRLEAAFPELAPTAEADAAALGDDRTGTFTTYRHREPMLSLDKAYSAAELHAFHDRVAKALGGTPPAYVVEPKFDGLAISVTYEHGRLLRAVTRGNGVEGDDVTANALTIAALPRELRATAPDGTPVSVPALIELRGEIYVGFAEFERINAERDAAGEPPFATPRNLAAGTLKQLDPRAVATRRLEIVFYGFGAVEPASALPATQRELHERIAAWGLPGVPEHGFARHRDELADAVKAIERARPKLAFPLDGAVVKLNAIADQRTLGTSRTAPRWALAYKFAAERVETLVLGIELQVGRTGVVTPVAHLAPVAVGGSTIARATLHNADELARRDVRVGDTVVIEKAGEIIPAIVSVNLARRPAGSQAFAFPTTCPSCEATLQQREGEVAIRCPNSACPAQLKRRIEHFASRGCVDIKGLGPATIDALVTNGRIRNVADLYRLNRADLLRVKGLGTKSADALLAAIEASRQAEHWRIIHGLGIPGVGPVGAQELAKRFSSLEALANATAHEYAAVTAYFAVPENRAGVADLTALGVRPALPEAKRSGALAGKTFVLTGTLPSLARAQATAKIEAAGGRVSERVTAKTDYFVAGAEPGAKLPLAEKIGVRIIDEAELLRLLEK